MKHAYLIMAHGSFKILKVLLRLIDDERNDIYVHIDKRCGLIDKTQFENVVQKSNIFFVERVKGWWGWLVDIEYQLFKEAVKGNYSYYHLLSGVDLPIKSQDYIHDFCAKNSGKLFVGFKDDSLFNHDWIERIHLFHKHFKTKNIFYSYSRHLFLSLQKKVNFKYRKSTDDFVFKKGPEWISVTHDFLRYVVENEDKAKKIYKHSYIPDEQFVQTLLYNSDFRSFIYDYSDQLHSCMRYVNWKNDDKGNNTGSPSPITLDDVKEIVKTDRLFARKFSEEHWDAVDFVEQYLRI